MGVATTESTKVAYEVAKATAEELPSVVNRIIGPCLDVLASVKILPLGVRSPGNNVEEVSEQGAASMSRFKEACIES